MGRQSKKSKEKKQKRKQEDAFIAGKQALVDEACYKDDPMEALLAFKKFDRNGLNVTIECVKADNMLEDLKDWCFELTKRNMQEMYEESGWGWNDKQKKEELFDSSSRFIICRDQENKPVAMTNFRFDMDFDDMVLYCYEIQLTKNIRRKGLGKFMMQILELLAHKYGMEKLMLTVFKTNNAAQDFFIKTLKFQVDETSPTESMVEALYDEDGYTYEILSKMIASKKNPLQPSDQNKQANAIASH